MDKRTATEAQPALLHTITTLEALKVFSDPLRQQIIEALLDGSKTVKQIAAELDLAPTKLYYHVNLLEEHGLIQVTETRIVSGIIEKHYTATAHEYLIERSLLTPGQNASSEGLEVFFDAMVEPIRAEVQRSFKQGVIDTSEDAPEQLKFRMWRAMRQLSDAQAAEFYARLNKLIDEFNALKTGNDDDLHYGLLIGIYPTTPPKKSVKP
ncbi:MAG TPA: helix-turn-helix domain-containing protein [Phototrophicaceae bacterium]|nr:helix-turn-helix domain-containing protein [Phototrophicaceae bacterium]